MTSGELAGCNGNVFLQKLEITKTEVIQLECLKHSEALAVPASALSYKLCVRTRPANNSHVNHLQTGPGPNSAGALAPQT